MTSFSDAKSYLLTSESVTEGHPDKVCDQVSDAILDAILEQDPRARVAAETAVTEDFLTVIGEVTTTADVPSQVDHPPAPCAESVCRREDVLRPRSRAARRLPEGAEPILRAASTARSKSARGRRTPRIATSGREPATRA